MRQANVPVVAMIVAMIVMVSGCATWDHQKERRDLLRGPKQIALGDNGYAEAKKKVQADTYVAADVVRYVDEGIAAATLNCRDYFNEVTLASRRGALARGEFNVGASVATALAAMWNASANLLAVMGIGVAAVNQLGDTYADVLIEAPETPAVRSRILELMNAYGARMRADAQTGAMTFPMARVQLAAFQDICSPASVRDLVNTSVRNVNVTVQPSGALTPAH